MPHISRYVGRYTVKFHLGTKKPAKRKQNETPHKGAFETSVSTTLLWKKEAGDHWQRKTDISKTFSLRGIGSLRLRLKGIDKARFESIDNEDQIIIIIISSTLG